MMLIHYLVKCTIYYYCTVNNVIHAVPNDLQTLLQIIDTLLLVDMPFMIPQVVYGIPPD